MVILIIINIISLVIIHNLLINNIYLTKYINYFPKNLQYYQKMWPRNINHVKYFLLEHNDKDF